jgi:hypothetical protein
MAGSGHDGERDRESHYRRAAMSHPLRRHIARRLSHDEEAGTAEISAELGEAHGRIAYHVRVLARRGVLRVVPKRRPAPPLYRWSADARWAREMLAEEDG